MSQRKAKPEAWHYADARRWDPKKEWVPMNDGRSVCVWQLSTREMLRLSGASARHPNDPRPGPNEEEAAIWQLALAIRESDAPDARRIFDDQNAFRVLDLAPEEFGRLMAAASRLMGLGQEAANGREDFTAAAAADSSPISLTGA